MSLTEQNGLLIPERRLITDQATVSRRSMFFKALLAGGGLAALIASERQAAAQQSTPTFEGVLYKSYNSLWQSSGALASTAVASQVRDGYFINVKDFGAKGDSTTDDTAAIQAAINAAGTPPSSIQINRPAARIYFPTGTYKVTLTGNDGTYGYALRWDNLASGATGMNFCGDGPSSCIQGTVAGYIFYNPVGSLSGGPAGFRDLSITNSATSNLSGAILCGSNQMEYIEDCFLNGYQVVDLGIHSTAGGENAHVTGCFFTSSAAANSGGSPGSWGLAWGGQTAIFGCTFMGFGGIGACLPIQPGITIVGCRFEDNLIAINIGVGGDASNQGGSDFLISSTSFEDNGTAIKVGGGNGLITGCSIQGENATQATAIGVDLRGTSGGITLMGVTCAGYFTQFGFVGIVNDPNTTLIGCYSNVVSGGGVSWSGLNMCNFIGCNYGPIGRTYANIVTGFSGSSMGAPQIGTQATFTDLAVAVGTTFSAGGGGTTGIGLYNGTAWTRIA